MDDQIIYHYTNLNAFKNIIESGQLWFTRIDSLNDYSEYHYFNDVYRKAVFYFFKDKKEDDIALALNKWLEYHLIKSRDNYYKQTYTLSFCKDSDSIPMWNYYSDKSGVAVGFDKSLLISLLYEEEKTNLSFTNGDILYDYASQISLVQSQLDLIYDKLIEHGEFNTQIVEGELINFIYASDSFKNNKFEYENEYRFTLVDLDDELREKKEKLEFIITNNNIKPVLKIDFADNWNKIITKIIISPLNTSYGLSDNIQSFLDFHNIKTAKVLNSFCPLR